jgi:hypothetical protein
VADVVAVKLAHPVDAATAEELGVVDVRDYQAAETAPVPRDQVVRLVYAGYVAGVDPGDAAAVRSLLGLPALTPGAGRPVGALLTETVPGPLALRPGQARYYNDTGRMLAIRMVRVSVETEPVGGPVRVDVKRNGISLWASESGQPAIADGEQTATAEPGEGRELLAPGSWLTFDIEQVGTTAPGEGLHVAVTVSDVSAFIGAPGHTPTLRSGSGPPVEQAADGDLYLQDSGELYQQQGGAWVLAGNLRGPAGNTTVTINGVTGNEFTLTPEGIGAETPSGAQALAEEAAAAAAAGSVPRDSELTTPPSSPLLRHVRTFTPDEATANLAEFVTGGVMTGWLNPWGGYRARLVDGAATAVRIYAGSVQAANPAEYVTAAGEHVLWGVDREGRHLHGNGQAPPVQAAPVLVLPTGAPVPPGTPAQTIIVRR